MITWSESANDHLVIVPLIEPSLSTIISWWGGRVGHRVTADLDHGGNIYYFMG
jgi:hypothetical protein